nr:MAG TPA: hypothetical protein [Caudoviricetes sp.]
MHEVSLSLLRCAACFLKIVYFNFSWIFTLYVFTE